MRIVFLDNIYYIHKNNNLIEITFKINNIYYFNILEYIIKLIKMKTFFINLNKNAVDFQYRRRNYLNETNLKRFININKDIIFFIKTPN